MSTQNVAAHDLRGTASVCRAMDGFGFYLIWFLIIAVITWLVLYSLKPGFVIKDDGSGDVDTAKVLIASIVVGLIFVILIWVVRRFAYY